MSRIILGAIVLYVIIIPIGLDAILLISIPAVLWMLAAAYSLMLRGKLPKNFFLLLAALAIAPVIVPPIVNTILDSVLEAFKAFSSSPIALILIAAAVLISFLYVRARLANVNHNALQDNHTNERQPIFPPDPDGGEEL